MSSHSVSRDAVDGAAERRLRELEQIRDDLELVAESEAEYSRYAQNLLDELEELDDV